MLRHGPVALFLHCIFEYLGAIACVAAPFVLDFRSDAATTWAFVAAGLLVLAALTTDGPRALVKRLPGAAHAAFDVLVATALLASPFVLGFRDENAPTTFFVAAGVLHLLLVIGTRYVSPARAHVGSLAATTSTHVTAGESTVVD